MPAPLLHAWPRARRCAPTTCTCWSRRWTRPSSSRPWRACTASASSGKGGQAHQARSAGVHGRARRPPPAPLIAPHQHHHDRAPPCPSPVLAAAPSPSAACSSATASSTACWRCRSRSTRCEAGRGWLWGMRAAAPCCWTTMGPQRVTPTPPHGCSSAHTQVCGGRRRCRGHCRWGRRAARLASRCAVVPVPAAAERLVPPSLAAAVQSWPRPWRRRCGQRRWGRRTWGSCWRASDRSWRHPAPCL